jgi:ketosteroid isomerase-like protein
MQFTDILKEFTAAVEAGDGRRLGALFLPDGVYHDTFYGEFKGPDAIAEMLEKYFWRDAEAFRWDMLEPAVQDDVGYARWVFSYTSKLPGAKGKRALFEGIGRFRLSGGKIRHYGEVFDIGIALTQVNFAPERIARILDKAAGAARGRHEGSRHLRD